jgi:hypothetical protein
MKGRGLCSGFLYRSIILYLWYIRECHGMRGKESDSYKVIKSHYGRGKARLMGMSHWRVIRTLWNKGKAGE